MSSQLIPASTHLPSDIEPPRAADIFKGQRDVLKKLLQSDLSNIANKLYSESIISAAALAEATNHNHIASDRTVSLLSVVEDKIRAEPHVFTKVIGILKSEPTLRSQAKDLLRECASERSQRQLTTKRTKKHICGESSSSDSSSSSLRPPRRKKGKRRRKKHVHTKRHRRYPSSSSSSSTSPTSTDSDSSHRRRHKAKKAKACPITSFREHVQAFYKNVPLEEKDELSFAACSDFIALALVHKDEKATGPLLQSTLHGGVDRIVANKTKIEMDEILAPDSQSPDAQPSFVLVEGPPGIGKTTFCRELCRRWDTLKHVRDYTIVLHLKLRQKHVQNVKSISDLLGWHRKHAESANQEVVDAMLKCSGEGILFVLDGFDEMPSSIVSDEDRLIMEIIRGEYLPKATRLVTSRPSALHDKNKHFPPRHRHVEILGFTDERKVEFAESAFKSEPAVAEHFKTFILSNPVINSLMYIPVNCAILARVYKDMKRDVKLMPKTMTQLYKVLVSVLIKRDMIKRGKWDEDTPVPSLEELPEKVPELERVCRLAYEGLFKEEVQLEFTDSDTGEDFQHLGLLKETKERDLMGVQILYSFLHLSIQEFLAACHVSWNTGLIDTAISESFVESSGHLQQLLWPQLGHYLTYGWVVKPHLYNFGLFLAGLVGYVDFPKTMQYYILYCLYEAQDAKYAELIDSETPILGLTTPMDMYVFGYALVHAPVKWVLTVSTSCDALVSSLTDHAPSTGNILGSIVKLSVDGDFVLPKSLSPIFLRALQFLEEFDLLGYKGSLHDILPSLRKLSNFCVYVNQQQLDDHSLYEVLAAPTHLASLMLYFTTSCPTQLAKIISSHSTLEHIELTSYVDRSTVLMHDYSELVVAALSCASVKDVTVGGLPFRLHKSDIPSITKGVQLTVLLDSYIHSILEVRLFDLLQSIAEGCGSPSMIRQLTVNTLSAFLPPPIFCHFLNVCNESLACNSFSVEFSVPPLDPCDCKYLSRALCRDSAISPYNLIRSKSLTDLTTVRQREEQDSLRTFAYHHHSCPDLLEIQSLRDVHDTLRQDVCPWLNLNLNNALSSSYCSSSSTLSLDD